MALESLGVMTYARGARVCAIAICPEPSAMQTTRHHRIAFNTKLVLWNGAKAGVFGAPCEIVQIGAPVEVPLIVLALRPDQYDTRRGEGSPTVYPAARAF